MKKAKHNGFLKSPEYPGGKEAFKKYIKENLHYPKEAIDNRIEGIVYLQVEIDDNGKVTQVDVQRGIGYGCDQEAERLMRNLRFGSVKNRGVRLKTKKNFKIQFSLPKNANVKFNYHLKKTGQDQTPEKQTYSYKINLDGKTTGGLS